jgi:hypothetical protein
MQCLSPLDPGGGFNLFSQRDRAAFLMTVPPEISNVRLFRTVFVSNAMNFGVSCFFKAQTGAFHIF